MRKLKPEDEVPYDVYQKGKKAGNFCCGLFFFLIGFYFPQEEELDVDYTKWLGKDYPKPNRVVTYICNHSSYMDTIYMVWRLYPAFVAKAEL